MINTSWASHANAFKIPRHLFVWCDRSGEGSLSKDYLHLDDHAKQITDTPGFKPDLP